MRYTGFDDHAAASLTRAYLQRACSQIGTAATHYSAAAGRLRVTRMPILRQTPQAN